MITVNEKQFRKIFRLVFEAYKNKTGVFSESHADNTAPQKLYIPEGVAGGDTRHLYWLALVAMSDRRTNSRVLYRNFAQMFSDHPKLFTIGFSPSIEEMTLLFRQYQIALPVSEIGFFITRKRHLDEFFGGDPKKIYENVSSIDDLMRKLSAVGKKHKIKVLFPGAKEKIFSLLAMYLSELSDFEFADIVPIDAWVQSIAASTGVLTGDGHMWFQTMEPLLRPLMSKVHKDYRQDHGSVNATWILGRYQCNRCISANMKDTCPIYAHCKGPFKRPRNKESGKYSGGLVLPLDFRKKFGT